MSNSRRATEKEMEYARRFLGLKDKINNIQINNEPPLRSMKKDIISNIDDDDYSEFLTLDDIIIEKPSTKIVRDFFKDNIEDLNNED